MMNFLVLLLTFAVSAPGAFGAADPVKIPVEYRDCSKDSDCESVPLRCGCCQFGSVAKVYVTEYLDYANRKACMDEPCRCQPMKLRPACVKGTCQLVSGLAAKTPKKKPARKKKRKSKARPAAK
jgi:hypothetical protein